MAWLVPPASSNYPLSGLTCAPIQLGKSPGESQTTHGMAGASSQLHVLGLGHHDPSVLHLISDYEEYVSSEHVLYLSLLVL